MTCSTRAQSVERRPPAVSPVPAGVRLFQHPCARELYEVEELPRVLAVELAMLGLKDLSTAASDAELEDARLPRDLAIVRMECGGAPDTVRIQVAHRGSQKAVQRDLSLAGSEHYARSRLLAMAAAGLIESSWSDLSLSPNRSGNALPLRTAPPASPIQPSGRSAPHPLGACAREVEPLANSHLLAAGSVRAFPAGQTGLSGFAVGYALRTSTHLLVWADLDAEFGRMEQTDVLGAASVAQLYWLTAGLGAAWTSATQPELAVGPFARVGYGLADADTERRGVHAKTEGGFVSLIGLSAQLNAPLSRSWQATLALEGGYMPNGVAFLSDRTRTAAMAEMTLALRIGILRTL